jgi:hypothetical protein
MVGSRIGFEPINFEPINAQRIRYQCVTHASVMVALLPIVGNVGLLSTRPSSRTEIDQSITLVGDRSVIQSAAASALTQSPEKMNGYRDTPSTQQVNATKFKSSNRSKGNSSESHHSDPSHPENTVPPNHQSEPVAYYTLLETIGTLEMGDRIAYQDGSLYDEYEIDGAEGQQVQIHLESPEFDPYLVLIGPNGSILAQNDDIAPDNYNAFLELVLPSDGIYRVVANGFDRHSRGEYRLIVLTSLLDAERLDSERLDAERSDSERLDSGSTGETPEVTHESLN